MMISYYKKKQELFLANIIEIVLFLLLFCCKEQEIKSRKQELSYLQAQRNERKMARAQQRFLGGKRRQMVTIHGEK